jgi:nitroreductase/NAD-dependent dihydropyrimidine dehydrogenase PreA subunit
MVTISIDPEICKRDGICVQVCPERVFVQNDEKSVPEPLHDSLCISCGQCIAACPHDAITHNDFPKGTVRTIKKGATPSYEQLLRLLHNRRSQRHFSGRPVRQKEIGQIIDAARYAPSALNAQSTKYLVIQDVVLLTEISQNAAEFLEGMIEELRKDHKKADLENDHAFNVIAKKVSEVQGGGEDVFLHNASALVLFYADRHASMGGINATLAVQNALLAAETLGIGAFYSGFVLFAIHHDPKLKKILKIPDDCEVHGALALGYPVIKFKKWIERHPADITWR